MLLWVSLALAILLGSAYYVILYIPGHSYVLGPLGPQATPAGHRVPSSVKSICLRARLTLSTRTRTRSPRR